VLLRKLIPRLEDIVEAWNRFQRQDILYFLFDDELPTNSILLKDSVDAVDNAFLDLKDILRKLRKLELGLCEDISHGVSDIFLYWPPNLALFRFAKSLY